MTMVDITAKPEVHRQATAKGQIKLKPATVTRIKQGKIEKGDPFNVAKVAGILAAKNTPSIIPLCHPLPLMNINIELRLVGDSTVEVEATVKTKAQTGVEMEALTAAAAALLTIWDMIKQYEKDSKGQYPTTIIENIRVTRKTKQEK